MRTGRDFTATCINARVEAGEVQNACSTRPRVYCLRHNSWPVQDDSADLLQFWTVHLNSYGWQEIVQAARSTNYERLRALISERAFPLKL
jgi:hypothetical protein